MDRLHKNRYLELSNPAKGSLSTCETWWWQYHSLFGIFCCFGNYEFWTVWAITGECKLHLWFNECTDKFSKEWIRQKKKLDLNPIKMLWNDLKHGAQPIKPTPVAVLLGEMSQNSSKLMWGVYKQLQEMAKVTSAQEGQSKLTQVFTSLIQHSITLFNTQINCV